MYVFFNNFIEKNQNKRHFEEGDSSHTSLWDGQSNITDESAQ